LRRRKVDKADEEEEEAPPEEAPLVEDILQDEEIDLFTPEERARYRAAVDDMMTRILGMSSLLAAEEM
jgi:hypothetical protein